MQEELTPITRNETFLAAAGGKSTDLEPITRKEMLLAKAAGKTAPEIEPITREEWFISQIKGGGASLPRKAINFHDFEGRIIHAFTREEMQRLSELPPLPKSETLVATQWSKTLPQVKEIALNGGDVDVAPADTETVDGKTRIYIALYDGRLAFDLGIFLNGTAEIDWGDGSEVDTITSTSSTITRKTHNYITAGNYCISFQVTGTVTLAGSGGFSLVPTTGTSYNKTIPAYRSAITSVIIGENCEIGGAAFNKCGCLKTVVISNGVTSIGSGAFGHCYALQNITIPGSVTSIGDGAFVNCESLQNIVIPDSVTSIGSSAFQECHALKAIMLPSGLTSLPDSLFAQCYSLIDVEIPENTTTIGSSFANCSSLIKITIPSSVTSILGSFVANYGSSFAKMRFKPKVPPTANSSSFRSLKAGCIIEVPYSEDHSILAAYQSAQYYPNPSTYTYVEYTDGE